MRLFGSQMVNPPQVRLDGNRIFVRPPLAEDWQAWAQLRAQSRSFLAPFEPAWPANALSRSTFLRRVRRQATEWRDDQAYNFLSFTRDTDELVGGLSLVNVRRGVAQIATLGYWVGAPFARRGYTTEAVRLVLAFGFRQLHLHRIEASCLPHNEPSRQLLEKAGFQYEGHARAYLRIDGAWRDHLLYALLHDDWLRLRHGIRTP